MAFTKQEILPQRWFNFIYYDKFEFVAGAAATELFQETISLSVPFKLTEIRAHMSIAFISAEPLVIRLSDAGLDSAYNTTLVSEAMLGVQDLFVHYSEPLLFLSDDAIVVELSCSTANLIGIELIGWGVRG